MSEYDRAAWEQIQEWKRSQAEKTSRTPAKLRAGIGKAKDTAGSRQAAWAQLHKLVGRLAREATWRELEKDAFVRLTRTLFAHLGKYRAAM